jgi:hypothetical protein
VDLNELETGQLGSGWSGRLGELMQGVAGEVGLRLGDDLRKGVEELALYNGGGYIVPFFDCAF